MHNILKYGESHKGLRSPLMSRAKRKHRQSIKKRPVALFGLYISPQVSAASKHKCIGVIEEKVGNHAYNMQSKKREAIPDTLMVPSRAWEHT
eukprot:6214675-Pleurochrysis_carterae.AAC.7